MTSGLRCRRSFQNVIGAAGVEAPVILITLVRLGLVPVMLVTFMNQPAVTTLALVAFVVADVHDGVWARHRFADGPARRALDSITDRLAIDSCLIGAYTVGALPLILLVAFLARDLFCALRCQQMMRSRRLAIKADWVYRCLNLSVAAWAVAAPFVSATTRTWMFGLVFAVSIVVAYDLTRSIGRVLRAPDHIRERVIRAGDIRLWSDPDKWRLVQESSSPIATLAPVQG